MNKMIVCKLLLSRTTTSHKNKVKDNDGRCAVVSCMHIWCDLPMTIYNNSVHIIVHACLCDIVQ